MMEGFYIDYYDEEEKAIYTYPDGMRLGFKLPLHHLECRNFWELIEEKNLYLLQRMGWRCFDGYEYILVVVIIYARLSSILKDCKDSNESNADEYIWRK